MRYQNGDISIDDSFARFGSKSYAIDKINSVDIKSEKAGGCAHIVAGLLCIIAGVMAVGAFQTGGTGLALFMGTVAVACGYWTAKASKAAQVVTYTIMLTTSSNEAQATQSTDLDEIQKMRDAIEAAMSR